MLPGRTKHAGLEEKRKTQISRLIKHSRGSAVDRYLQAVYRLHHASHVRRHRPHHGNAVAERHHGEPMLRGRKQRWPRKGEGRQNNKRSFEEARMPTKWSGLSTAGGAGEGGNPFLRGWLWGAEYEALLKD